MNKFWSCVAMARAVSQASAVFVAAIDNAAPLMPQRADVRKAVPAS